MQRLLKNNRGMALPLVMVILLVFVLFSAVVIGMGNADTKFSASEENNKQAYYYARTGAEAVASYIVENPDHLSTSAMSNIINTIITAGNSNPFKISSTDSGNIVVTVSKNGSNIEISSTGTYQGANKRITYTVNASTTGGTGGVFDKAIYAKGPMNIIGQTVTGNIAGLDTIYLDYGSINGTVYIHPDSPPSVFSCPAWQTKPTIANLTEVFDFPDFPFPNFPAYPTGLLTVNTLLKCTARETIGSNNYYANGISVQNSGALSISRGDDNRIIRTKYLTITGNAEIDDLRTGNGRMEIYVDGDLTIDRNTKLNINLGNGDVVIRAKRLLLPQGNIVVNRTGSGKLYIYVDDVIQLDGSSKINVKTDMTTMGDPSTASVYFAGGTDINGNNITDGTASTNYLHLGGDIKVAALLQFKQAQVSFDNSAGITGSVISGGKRLVMSGGSYADVKAIYAPNADVRLLGGASVKGSIISNTFTLDGGSTVTYTPLDQDDQDFFSNIIGTTVYSYGNWK